MTLQTPHSGPLSIASLAGEGTGASLLEPGGERQELNAAAAISRLTAERHLVCHSTYLIARLAFVAGSGREMMERARGMRHLDVAELFAFTVPALPATPTPAGLARALGLSLEETAPETIRLVAQELLTRLSLPGYPHPREAAQVATFLGQTNWPWAEAVLEALKTAQPDLDVPAFTTGLNAWDRLPEWEDDGGRPPGTHEPVGADEARRYLEQVLGPDAEKRSSQLDYCAETTGMFQPRQSPLENDIVLAEAGTGLGKTLGYLAPAHIWAKRNKAPVWVSTYTKNLQRQLRQESHRLVEDPAEHGRKIVVRKGRENYVCLLNMQEAFSRLTAGNPDTALMAALISRWVRYSRDGDMVGGDFPAWLMGLFAGTETLAGRPLTPQSLGLTDRRGECIYSACPHYRKCFLEHAVRSARKAEIVIANHALVLYQAAIDHAIGEAQTTGDQETSGGLGRLIFDEGHHLFDAADSAFSGHLTGLEMAELRRWIRGPETRRRRGRSLADRIGELSADDPDAEQFLQAVQEAARALPGPGWQARVQAGTPDGKAEAFLTLVRQQTMARADNRYGLTLETDCRPMIDDLAEAAGALAAALIDLKRPMSRLAAALLTRLDQDASELTSADRARIEALARSLKRRGELMTGGWIDMLERLLGEDDEKFVDWFSVEQQFGREVDTGLHSHWVDPTEPLASAVLSRADGVMITSATLKDRPPDMPDDWRNAEMRTGVVHLPYAVTRVSHESPFDYPANARIVVVNDINRDDPDQTAAAYRELFKASGGAGLGLFTAISRLRSTYRRIAEPLAKAGLPLYAQHVDPIDTGTLVDMFRAETSACLLGTDAVRDGVDVPGDSLRLMVLDRVPWPQPTILARARKQAFDGNAYQDMVVRLKLRQAFGRLIRRADDRGVFVVLDSRLASRFCTAFPPGVAIERIGLADAIDVVNSFIGPLAGSASNE